MSAIAHELAELLEARYREFADYIASLTPEQWRARCGNHPEIRIGDEDENRPVGTVAHHTAAALPRMVSVLRSIAAGEEVGRPNPDANAEHARANPEPDQAETAALARRNAAEAAAYLRGLSDQELARTGRTMIGEMSAADVVRRIWVGHAAWHEGSIRATVGHEQREPTPRLMG